MIWRHRSPSPDSADHRTDRPRSADRRRPPGEGGRAQVSGFGPEVLEQRRERDDDSLCLGQRGRYDEQGKSDDGREEHDIDGQDRVARGRVAIESAGREPWAPAPTPAGSTRRGGAGPALRQWPAGGRRRRPHRRASGRRLGWSTGRARYARSEPRLRLCRDVTSGQDRRRTGGACSICHRGDASAEDSILADVCHRPVSAVRP